MTINPSKYESELFELNFGRGDVDSIDSKELFSTIVQGNYDICRIKVKANSDDIIENIEKIGFPFYFSGAITTYKIDFSNQSYKPYRDPKITFEPYDGEKHELFQKLLTEVFSDYPLSYYTVPVISKLISLEKQQLGVSSYFADTHFNNSNRLAWFVKYEEEYVGILTTRTWDNLKHGEGTLSGVIPKYRNSGLFLDIISFIQNYCIENKIKWGHTGARLHEIASHKFFTKQGMYVENGYLVFYISSLLSKSEKPPIVKSLLTKEDLLIDIIASVNKIVKDKILFRQHLSNFSSKMLSGKSVKLTFTFPIWNEKEELIVAQLHSQNNELLMVGYFEYKTFTEYV